jgi:hypothetical protein
MATEIKYNGSVIASPEAGQTATLKCAGMTMESDVVVEVAENAGGGGSGGSDAVIVPLTITENGTYTAEDGVDGYSPITVEVAASGGDGVEIARSIVEGTITEYSDSEVTKVGTYAFAWSPTLRSVDLPNVTSVDNNAFDHVESLISINLPKATRFGDIVFSTCSRLKSINFPNLTSVGHDTFNSCSMAESVYLPNLTSAGLYAFANCESLKSIVLPKLTLANTSAFNACMALESIDFPNVTTVNATAFNGCYKLTRLILRSLTRCTLKNKNAFNYCYHILGTVNATYNPGGDKDGYIYVPRALVDSYKGATNWSNFATQFRALEDYTVDGTTTGALDESKI